MQMNSIFRHRNSDLKTIVVDNMKTKTIILFSITLFLGSCSNNSESEIKSGQQKVEKEDTSSESILDSKITVANLYCWAFYKDINENNNTIKITTTPVRINPGDIIEEGNLIDSINKVEELDRLNELLLSEYEIIDTIQGMDSRLIIELQSSTGKRSTLTYFNDSTLCYNNEYLYKYKCNVRDLIKEAFHIESIICNEYTIYNKT